MKALQYIYTSWKNGTSTEKGYMIYSRSEGITEAECAAIKDVMQYIPPKELSIAPTQQEITDVFPYAFAYFKLPTGRGCVAQSTYLGRDYSGRFGNYIIYALVFDIADLPNRPAEMFAQPYIKTAMTEEELNASSPVPPLPPIEISEYGSVVNDDQLNEFLFGNEKTFAQVFSMMLKAREMSVPFYLNDTRENLVLWAAAIERALPPCMAMQFTFNTYMYDQELMRASRIKEKGLEFYLVGVRPDANYFNYAVECKSDRHLVMDLLDGNMSEGVDPLPVAGAMAFSLTMGMEEVEAFGRFVDSTSFRQINGQLQDAYLYYQLLRNNQYEHCGGSLQRITEFGINYCSESDNAELGSKLLMLLQEAGYILSLDDLKKLWRFINRYAGFMMYALYDITMETMYQCSAEARTPCDTLAAALDELQQEMPQRYNDFLRHFDTTMSVDQMLLYLEGHDNLHTNTFFIKWILKNYRSDYGLSASQPVYKLFAGLMKNIGKINGSEELIITVLIASIFSESLFKNVLAMAMQQNRDPLKSEKLCSCYAEKSVNLSEGQTGRFEKMLFETPEATPLATKLIAKKMETCKEPYDAFWRFYINQKIQITEGKIAIDAMVNACMDRMDEQERLEMATDLLQKIDITLFRDVETIRRITDAINNCNIKALMKIDSRILEYACQLQSRMESEGMQKVRAVLLGEELLRSCEQTRRIRGLSEKVKDKNVSLVHLSKADYEVYSKNYFNAYFSAIQSIEDIELVMGVFYHPQLFSSFVNDYTSAIKKAEKREPRSWKQLVIWTCAYVLTAPRDDMAADGLYKPMTRYLRSVDEDLQKQIRKGIEAEVPKSSCDRLFEEIQRKEGLSEKLGGLFRRK